MSDPSEPKLRIVRADTRPQGFPVYSRKVLDALAAIHAVQSSAAQRLDIGERRELADALRTMAQYEDLCAQLDLAAHPAV